LFKTAQAMAIQTLTCQAPVGFLAWKHPEDNITLGSSIVVNESQEACLFENGQLIATLGPGRHLVESGNIPGLEGIISRAFGGSSPIVVQVWFFNKAASFDYKWGSQIQVRDNTHGLLVPLGARGSYALRIADPASFVLQMVGVNTVFTTDEVRNNLLPVVERNLKDYIAEQVTRNNADVFTIASELREISEGIKSSLSSETARFGMELVDFYVQALDVVGDDPAFQAIKQGLAQAATLRVRAAAAADVGNFYQLERSLDALNAAASNEGGAAGALLAGGLGIGMGLGAGQQMGQVVNNSMAVPPAAQTGLQAPPQEDIGAKLQKLKSLLDSGLISENDYNAKKDQLLSAF